jgi:ABC-type uncharacterized transport system ATPase subunit
VLLLHQGKVVTEGRVARLLAAVAGSKEVELQIHSPIDLEGIRSLPEVEAVSASGHIVSVMLARGANPARVLAVLNGTSELVSTMRVRQPNLGDLFLKLTGVPLQEEAAR